MFWWVLKKLWNQNSGSCVSSLAASEWKELTLKTWSCHYWGIGYSLPSTCVAHTRMALFESTDYSEHFTTLHTFMNVAEAAMKNLLIWCDTLRQSSPWHAHPVTHTATHQWNNHREQFVVQYLVRRGFKPPPSDLWRSPSIYWTTCANISTITVCLAAGGRLENFNMSPNPAGHLGNTVTFVMSHCTWLLKARWECPFTWMINHQHMEGEIYLFRPAVCVDFLYIYIFFFFEQMVTFTYGYHILYPDSFRRIDRRWSKGKHLVGAWECVALKALILLV